MRFGYWHVSAIVVSLLGVTLNGQLTGPALAVMDTPLVAPEPQAEAPKPAPAEPQAPARLDIPVSWQLTKTRLMGPGATTMTESFKESWTLEIRPGGVMFLKSPRANVPAYASGADASSPIPHAVVVGEKDFARLVGVPIEQLAEAEDGEPSATLARPVTINFGRARNAEITMSWSEDEHYAVNLDIGTNTLF